MKDGKAVTTSLKIAEVFGKQHKDILKAIRELDCPKDFAGRNFAPGSYKLDFGEIIHELRIESNA